MRVFISCLQSLTAHAIPAYDFWRAHFVNGAEEAGLEVLEAPDVDWAEGLVPMPADAHAAWLDRTWERTLAFVRREHARRPIAFFLGYLYPQQVEATAVQELRRLGIPSVNFFCDNVREFRKVPEAYRCFTLNWVPEFEALPMYRTAGLAHLHAPMPSWVPPHLRTSDHPESEPPTFIGSVDVLRRNLMADAIARGAHVVVRGRGWDRADEEAARPGRGGRVLRNQLAFVRQHGTRALVHKTLRRLRPPAEAVIPADHIGPIASAAEYIRISQQSIVTLGINRVPTITRSLHRPLTYSRLRDLEAPMLGACYLTEWTAGLPSLYEPGTEIETYRDADELVAKLATLTGDRERRQRLRREGQRRALARNSVPATLRRIIDTLQIDGAHELRRLVAP